MKALYEDFGIKRLLVEGGGTVHRSMIAAGLYDELHLILCPFVIGGASSITPVQRGAFWPKGEIPRYRLERRIATETTCTSSIGKTAPRKDHLDPRRLALGPFFI